MSSSFHPNLDTPKFSTISLLRFFDGFSTFWVYYAHEKRHVTQNVTEKPSIITKAVTFRKFYPCRERQKSNSCSVFILLAIQKECWNRLIWNMVIGIVMIGLESLNTAFEWIHTGGYPDQIYFINTGVVWRNRCNISGRWLWFIICFWYYVIADVFLSRYGILNSE